uniref:Uncharacterized protein n=1 Tax=Arundo donax TaxID=35708 RepID=A0A0A9BND1_ARUDO
MESKLVAGARDPRTCIQDTRMESIRTRRIGTAGEGTAAWWTPGRADGSRRRRGTSGSSNSRSAVREAAGWPMASSRARVTRGGGWCYGGGGHARRRGHGAVEPWRRAAGGGGRDEDLLRRRDVRGAAAVSCDSCVVMEAAGCGTMDPWNYG